MQFNGASGLRTYIRCMRIRANKKNGERQMTKMKTLSAAMVLAVAVATPVFAKSRTYHNEKFNGAYNQMSEPSFAVPSTQAERNIENFGFSGRDPSRVGGWDPNLNPPS
jgi:hypothetical protein